MHKPHKNPAQLDLFGSSGNGNRVATPQWQNLPTGTRHKITGLMARLLMEHDGSHPAEDVDDPILGREGGDV